MCHVNCQHGVPGMVIWALQDRGKWEGRPVGQKGTCNLPGETRTSEISRSNGKKWGEKLGQGKKIMETIS